MKKYNKSIFIFRRDLRLVDNNGLNAALTDSKFVVPCFIFDQQQVGNKNQFKSKNAIQFMIESLFDLDDQLQKKQSKLFVFYGSPEKVIKDLINSEGIDAVFVNRDYTPFSIKRDEKIKNLCLKNNVAFEQHNDLLLHEPEVVMSQSGTPYTIFTPFYKKARALPVELPQKFPRDVSLFSGKISDTQSLSKLSKKILTTANPQLAIKPGRKNGMKILNSINTFKDYRKTRDFPAIETTHLSAHLKFGTISIRETYHAIKDTLGKDHDLLRQLFWRDFFTHLAYHSPFVFGHAFREKYEKIKWSNNEALFKQWCDGKTGFPLVDAGMRQLNATGFMHNRVRMVVASFLVKDLHIDWRLGEQYFAKQLVDYDPAVNNGNWQWCASTGADAQPYFRIFNPWLQQKKFDPGCTYIKRWLHELKSIDPKVIHNLHKKDQQIKNYPRPIIDHTIESRKAINNYKNI